MRALIRTCRFSLLFTFICDEDAYYITAFYADVCMPAFKYKRITIIYLLSVTD